MHILITGATGGIGVELIKALSGENVKITAHGRNTQSLKYLKKVHMVNTLEADISTPQGIETIATYAQKNPIDVLINNAGVLYMQEFQSANAKSIQTTININITALISLTHKILPLMQAKKTPCRIVNIGSVAGSLAMPYLATYCASKFAVKGFSESLHRELFDSNVNITYIAPRGVDTPMISTQERRVFKTMFSRIDSPEIVAKSITNAIRKNKNRLTIGWWERFSILLNSIAPSQIDLFFWIIRTRIKKILKD